MEVNKDNIIEYCLDLINKSDNVSDSRTYEFFNASGIFYSHTNETTIVLNYILKQSGLIFSLKLNCKKVFYEKREDFIKSIEYKTYYMDSYKIGVSPLDSSNKKEMTEKDKILLNLIGEKIDSDDILKAIKDKSIYEEA